MDMPCDMSSQQVPECNARLLASRGKTFPPGDGFFASATPLANVETSSLFRGESCRDHSD